MKTHPIFIVSFILIFFSATLQAQFTNEVRIKPKPKIKTPYSLTSFTLNNGLQIYLNEDHSQKDILGAVIVRGGAKLDPKNASGTAHYFEHMMFKGTKTLGTIDYKKEKPYLDSISQLYDLLRLDRHNEIFRKRILKKIDSFSVVAARYAIPNEFDKVVSELGATNVNAYTNYENIVYHNRFPKQSISQWIELYRDRFENPVFRLFQSELETVYEEKNMSMDNTFRRLYRALYKSFYPKSVYGRRSVLGSIDDLKNPSLSAMETYFKEYYNADNMALVLIGDFDTQKVIPLIKAQFSKWRDGEKAVLPSAKENPFRGRVLVNERLTPIPVGAVGYRSVTHGNKDELAIDVIANILTNDNNTGLIDSLTNSQQLLGAKVIVDKHFDKGGVFVFYVPKPIIQSLNNAERKILAQINRLKTGNFSEELLSAVKVSMMKDETLNMENSSYRLTKILNSYMTETKWSRELNYNNRIKGITKADIISIANKYFGDNYLAFHSKIGFPKKIKIIKPAITPLNPINKNAISVEAGKIESMPLRQIKPSYIDFNKEVIVSDIENRLHLYYVKNPMNNIFSMNIRIGMGKLQNPQLEVLAFVLNNAGAGKLSHEEFAKNLQEKGIGLNIYVNNNYFTIALNGFDKDLSEALSAVNSLLSSPNYSSNTIKKFIRERKLNKKMIKKEVNSQIAIVNEYATYGNKSIYLNTASTKEIKKLKLSDYKKMIRQLLAVESYVHYVGGADQKELTNLLKKELPFAPNLVHTASPIVRAIPKLSTNEVYFLNNKNAIQSHIRIGIPSRKLDESQRVYIKPFNRYFGLGMNSIVFKEIREYRALAYGAWAYFSIPYRYDKPGMLKAGMSTQADKTNEAVNLMLSLIDSVNINEDQLASLQKYLLRSFNATIPDFRYRSYIVQKWILEGYTTDPRRKSYQFYQELTKNDIANFYDANVQKRNYLLSIVGDSRKINLNKIKTNANFHLLKLKNIIKY